MLNNFEKLLESCVGPLVGNGIEITQVKKEQRGRYALMIGGTAIADKRLELMLQWEPQPFGALMMAVPFPITGYRPELRPHVLEMINALNCDSTRISTALLIEGDHDIRALTRLSFILHPEYLTDEAWRFSKELIRTNVMMLVNEMATACAMVSTGDELVGTA